MAKIISILVLTLILLLSVFAGIQTVRNEGLTRSNMALLQSVEQYRSDLELARRANERYADTFREASESNTRIGECLSEHISTLSQFRSQLQAVRTEYERMQRILTDMADMGNIGDGNNRDIDSGGGAD